MNGIDLLNNMVGELRRAKYVLLDIRQAGNFSAGDDIDFLIDDIEADLVRYYDVADFINAVVEDIVVCE